ncbi:MULTISPECIES: peptide chain release factor 2 [unclassified Campylobacter]|uniref:peptide chain release factor 2 n=1 Tax=unclassified Campylobacter TaxID=2593542 RepID=UPI001B532D9D|nr:MULTISPECIES: peptide chain release factor 2 [unclassified Campylobacter]MBP3224918.1 peptide chain release factor 2 [Campylobacter sp.]MDA3043489.1 peptide chain release factor 2 [Campylobacter sp. JMF_09 ED2]MDA3045243.1 peptide chain release factor 2 [Campylobacter sp. JMF_07 ED4]MDA3064157.1 peptide chain release factor 2 [Campylobacter sp. JMF_11 EL3]MDA3071971.1 peptide chain release factor 2 [Campylobacter sp. VBCF_03 NA9]
MDNYEYSELLKNLDIKINNISSIIKPDEISARLEEISKIEADEKFWSDVKLATQIGREKTKISSVLAKFKKANSALDDAREIYELALSENDDDTINDLFEGAGELEEEISNLELAMMLGGDDDDKNAIITIHPGAGGTESCDWAGMLYRMYSRFCEREGFKVEVLDFQEGDEAGIKDVSFIVRGENAYGYLKAENGIHRLVRTSPFDSAGRRHTSFSSVMVSPELNDDIEINIEDKDIKIDVFRASGAGGQHINKTESAVRITHLATGIVVNCQNDRSQHKNKETAMKVLKSRLYELELMKKREASDSIEKSDIGWGHQIRSYVLFPYQQVKDNRSGEAFSQTDAILDGDIKKLIEGVLISQANKQ